MHVLLTVYVLELVLQKLYMSGRCKYHPDYQ